MEVLKFKEFKKLFEKKAKPDKDGKYPKITPEEFNELPAVVHGDKKPGKGRPSIDKKATQKGVDEYNKKKKKK